MSCVLKLRSYTVDESTVRPRTGFVAIEHRYPRDTISSYTPSARARDVVVNWTLPFAVTVPSVSSRPASRSRRCASAARRYAVGTCLLPSSPLGTQDRLHRAVIVDALLAPSHARDRSTAVRTGRRGESGPHALALPPHDLAARLHERLVGHELGSADDTGARLHSVGLGKAQAVPEVAQVRRVNPLALDVGGDLRIRRREVRSSTRAVTEPHTQRVRRNGQVRVGQLQRLGIADAVIQPAVGGRAPQRRADLPSRADRGEGALVAVAVVLRSSGLG